jgi:polysaccharide biosynthesis transport protein
VEERQDVISLQDYLVVLRRRRWLIVGVVIVVVAAALAVSLTETPVYESDAEIVVEPVRRTQDVSFDESLWYGDLVATEQQVMTSRPVALRAAETLGIADPYEAIAGVRVESVTDTRVLRVIAADTDPATAAATANAVAEGYLAHRRGQAVENVVAARTELDQRADTLRGEIDALDEDAEGPEREALVAQLSAIVAQSAELGNTSGAVTGGGEILTPAEVAVSPVSPNPVRTGALAVVLGLVLGIGLAFLRDHFDDVIRDESDFKRATGGLPVLGRIPRWEDPEGGQRLATLLAPASIASEAYRELSAGVRFLLVARGRTDQPRDGRPPAGTGDGTVHAVMLCSATAGDGKTSTAANLAVAAARVGLRTLLVDADLRRPTVAKRFGLGRTSGLSDVLLHGHDLQEHAVDVGVEHLRVLPAGSSPPNPNELLASTAMRMFEQEALRQADLVIYDSPAVLAVPDALELGRQVDVTVLVGRAGTTGRRQLAAAKERLHQVGIEVSGTVLNDLNDSHDGYYYTYYYGSDEASATPEVEPRRGRRGRRRAQRESASEVPSPSATRTRRVDPPAEVSDRDPAAGEEASLFGGRDQGA